MTRKPFFRKHDGWWYIQIRQGSKRFLKKLIKGRGNEQEAYRLFNEIMAEGTDHLPPPTRLKAHDVLHAFLHYSAENNEADTFEWYKQFLTSFDDLYGCLKPHQLTQEVVEAWLNANPDWGPSTHRAAVTALKRAFNWAHENRKIHQNPLKSVRKPKARARERFLTAEERRKILDSFPTGDPFRDFLTALEHTGARPGEVAAVTAADVDLRTGVWTLRKHKTDRTGDERVIILTPKLIELTERLMREHPEGPLFRNTDGKPWNRNSIRCRFRRVREKLGLGEDVCAYLYRHAFATDALENGAGIVDVCELLGHRSTDMVMKYYSKIRNRRDHLRQQAMKATCRNE